MYTEYWGITKKPFENTPDPAMFFSSSKHQEALMRMLYVIKERQGGGLLTGDYGTGKTILTYILSSHLSLQQYRFVLIINPQMPAIEFIKEIVRKIAVIDKLPDGKSDLTNILSEVLRRNNEIGREIIIVVDDAQLVKDNETLEELRLLLSLQLNDRFLLTLLLLGQTELREKINRLPQLRQRLVMRYHLEPMDEEETGEYILHRMRVCGRSEPIFTNLAIKEIYEHSQGIPREINNLCNWCLLVGFTKKVDTISLDLVKDVIREME